MDDKELSNLREIAFEVTIDPKNPVHAASAEDVVKVLKAYIDSYKSFLAAKLRSENNSEEEISATIKETQLLIVDTDFNSFHSAIAPYNPNSHNTTSFFNQYKSDILSLDVDNYSNVLALRNKFTKKELQAIYGPIFSVISNKYDLKVKTSTELEVTVKKPRKSFNTYFKERKEKIMVEREVNKDNGKLFQVFVQTSDLNHISTKDILYSSELPHETYPYTLDKVTYNEKTIYFHDTIICQVDYEDDLYFISYPELKIEVWGESRKEAENAFDFTFYSLVLNYVKEKDENLTNDAIQLKNKLKTMIRLIK
ncbi:MULTISPECIES: hypothetical protein [Chryseobacterium]|uniref:hypothetical protein n=1 Tax=Chryseobacterium TaxID=59732 RepID=UPI001B1B776A|nr:MULTISPECIES: hypothetical protein [Chryseobacterium]MBO9690868.1 hypothetical protein [Chryseobacterium sp.]MCE4064889.1 hypothetical protein [Chryseobacterium gleum]